MTPDVLAVVVNVVIVLLSLILVVMMIYIAKRHPLRHAREISGAVAAMVVLFGLEPVVAYSTGETQYHFWLAMTLIMLLYLAGLLVKLICDIRDPPEFTDW